MDVFGRKRLRTEIDRVRATNAELLSQVNELKSATAAMAKRENEARAEARTLKAVAVNLEEERLAMAEHLHQQHEDVKAMMAERAALARKLSEVASIAAGA